jgi:hypothetical protein
MIINAEEDSAESDFEVIPRPARTIRERLLAMTRPAIPIPADPNRRFNPDVLWTIADFLVEAQEYKTVLNLAVTSRHLNHGLQPYLRHMRKRAVLKLEDLKLRRTQNWDQVKCVSKIYFDLRIDNSFQVHRMSTIQSSSHHSHLAQPHTNRTKGANQEETETDRFALQVRSS